MPKKQKNFRGKKPAIGYHTGRKILAAVNKNRNLTAAAVFRDN
jgi:hypothetical protein